MGCGYLKELEQGRDGGNNINTRQGVNRLHVKASERRIHTRGLAVPNLCEQLQIFAGVPAIPWVLMKATDKAQVDDIISDLEVLTVWKLARKFLMMINLR